jgi:small subunit ribosomal protein S1
MSDWEESRGLFEADQTVSLLVVGYNRGGLLVEWSSLRGFVPASQLVDFPSIPDGPSRRAELAARVGQRLTLRVIELDAEQNRLILSERAARAQPGERAELLTRVRPGDTVSGVVTNLCDFGAFVDLGGLEGLIHISEMSWGRVGHPADLVQRGHQVEAYVLSVHPDAGRIALSLKRLRPDPWETVHLRYRVGETVSGTVTNVVDFGAFARIEEGLEGLIHVSELAEGHFLHPRNVVSEGQTIQARILHIDGRARRMGLTLREPTG